MMGRRRCGVGRGPERLSEMCLSLSEVTCKDLVEELFRLRKQAHVQRPRSRMKLSICPRISKKVCVIQVK